MTPRPTVRHAVPADEPRLHDLQRHLDERAPALLDAVLAGVFGTCLVAVDDADRPVGYLLAVDGDGGPPVPSASDAAAVGDGPPVGGDPLLGGDTPTVHVAELVVAPAARRNGHASALLATLLSVHPGETVTLTVAPDNDAALSLYEGFGFEQLRELPDCFDDGPGRLLARRPRPE
jgi:ribosomal protein S18 acetylase RimI-like enzyme